MILASPHLIFYGADQITSLLFGFLCFHVFIIFFLLHARHIYMCLSFYIFLVLSSCQDLCLVRSIWGVTLGVICPGWGGPWSDASQGSRGGHLFILMAP